MDRVEFSIAGEVYLGEDKFLECARAWKEQAERIAQDRQDLGSRVKELKDKLARKEVQLQKAIEQDYCSFCGKTLDSIKDYIPEKGVG